MENGLMRVIEVEKRQAGNRTVVVDVCFVGGQDSIEGAPLMGTFEHGLVVDVNGHTKLVILANATTVEFRNV